MKQKTTIPKASTIGKQLIDDTSDWQETGMPTRLLGKTGERVSLISIGGWHLGLLEEALAIRMMHMAIDNGMTFFDNAWDYHDGRSEEFMGKALTEGKREKVFLMTKNCERDYKGSLANLEDSLRRMKTDYIDLWQFHEINYDNDPNWVFESGGMKAALEAQQAGKVRHIGFTGHKDPRLHLKMIGMDYDWATSQMPINILDAHYRSFQKEVVPVCLEQNIGVIGMKSLGGGSKGGIIPGAVDISPEACIRYALSQPVSSLVSGMRSIKELEENIGIARSFTPMPDNEKQAILDSVRDVAGDGRHEHFKSTQIFDGPHHKKQHGFS